MQWHYSESPRLIQAPERLSACWYLLVKAFSAMSCGLPSWIRVHNTEQKSQLSVPKEFLLCRLCAAPADKACHTTVSWSIFLSVLAKAPLRWGKDRSYLLCVCVRMGVCLKERVGFVRHSKRKTDGARLRWREFDIDWTVRFHQR